MVDGRGLAAEIFVSEMERLNGRGLVDEKMARDFKRLDVWKRSIKLGKSIYGVVDTFPQKENYALSSQLRRAVVSVSSNIAEGCGRKTNKDFVNFLYIALGSLKEVESQLFIAKEFGYLGEDKLSELDGELNEIGKMLMGFINYISRD